MRTDKPVNEMTEADYIEADKVWEILGEAWIKLLREYGAFRVLTLADSPHPLSMPATIVTIFDGLDAHDLKLLLTVALRDQYAVRDELRRALKELEERAD